MTDIEIAESANVKPIKEIAAKIGLSEDDISPYGKYVAKVPLNVLDKLKDKEDGKLVMVTAITPTPAGEGRPSPPSGSSRDSDVSARTWSEPSGNPPSDPPSV